MHPQQEMRTKVLLAVQEFAQSIGADRDVVADLSPLVEATNLLPLSNLDYWERLIRSEFTLALESHYRSRWFFRKKPSTLLTWIDLLSPDGYRREKTLRTISGAAPNRFFFAAAVRRLNDWVPQVRQAARETLPAIASATEPESVVDAVFLTLVHWNSWKRMGHEDKDVVLEITSRKEIVELMKARMISATSGALASILGQIGRTSVLDDHLSEIAMRAAQPAVRAKAYKSQLDGKMVWLEGRKWEWTDVRYCKGRLHPVIGERNLASTVPYVETLNLASVDRSPIVRRVAAEILIRDLDKIGAESGRLAARFSSDKTPSVAERGTFALNRLSERH